LLDFYASKAGGEHGVMSDATLRCGSNGADVDHFRRADLPPKSNVCASANDEIGRIVPYQGKHLFIVHFMRNLLRRFCGRSVHHHHLIATPKWDPNRIWNSSHTLEDKLS